MSAEINERIEKGYELLRSRQTEACCQEWLGAWENIKALMADGEVRDLHELQGKYNWTVFIMNYVQELEMELYNAAINNSEYALARIRYCQELLPLLTEQDQLCIENTRRALAESLHRVGDFAECDRLFEGWLADDPDWGWGWIGWASCYLYGAGNGETDLVKAGSIIQRAIAREGVRHRRDVIEHATEVFSSLGEQELVDQLKAEMSQMTNTVRFSQTQTHAIGRSKEKVVKIGRNQPCICGSGKKYKKCCGR